MPLNPIIEPGCEWTSPDNRGRCAICGGKEGGYAKKDSDGNWLPMCWPCVKPKIQPPPMAKRATIGTVYTDLNETDEPEPKKKKNPGMAPSTHRPKVN
jgi:hypothetical protein